MIQIIGLLLCVYLAVKGVEVLLMVLVSPREQKSGAQAVAVLTLIVCWLAAGLTAITLIDQSASIGASIPSAPSTSSEPN